MNAGDLTGPSRSKVGCDNAVAFRARRFLIDPTDTIVMQDVVTQVPNAQDSADKAERREHKQQCTRELVSRFPH